MKWLRGLWRARRDPGVDPDDPEIARLTAKADLILEELDTVVSELTSMLRKAAE